ncbi:MAG: hypothetical protein L7S72_07935 [Flavobacteriales bacterium]|nr:hypothetical protein [Flavobacteriales bacterium]
MSKINTAEVAKKVRADLVKDQLMNELKALITDEVLVINQKNKPYIKIKNPNKRGKNENK